MSSNITVQRICEYCNQVFDAKTTKTRYCSHDCNKKHYKVNLRNKKIEASNEGRLQTMSKVKEPIKDMDFLTVREASLLLKISIKTIYRLIQEGDLNAINLTERNTLIRRKDIDFYFDANLNNDSNDLSNLEREINIKNSYTMEEAQKKFNISSSGLYNLIVKFKIPKKKYGKFVLVKKEYLDKILN